MKWIQLPFLVAIVSILFSSCGSSATPPGNESNPLFTISGTIDGVAADIDIFDMKITETGIIGLEILLSTLENGTEDDSIETDEQQLKIKINDVSSITLESDYTIGNGNDLITLEDEVDRFFATSGTLNFTQIGNQDGDAVELTYTIGMVNDDFDDTKVAQYSGEISDTVSSD
jgi:hypothetical protein